MTNSSKSVYFGHLASTHTQTQANILSIFFSALPNFSKNNATFSICVGTPEIFFRLLPTCYCCCGHCCRSFHLLNYEIKCFVKFMMTATFYVFIANKCILLDFFFSIFLSLLFSVFVEETHLRIRNCFQTFSRNCIDTYIIKYMCN